MDESYLARAARDAPDHKDSHTAANSGSLLHKHSDVCLKHARHERVPLVLMKQIQFGSCNASGHKELDFGDNMAEAMSKSKLSALDLSLNVNPDLSTSALPSSSATKRLRYRTWLLCSALPGRVDELEVASSPER